MTVRKPAVIVDGVIRQLPDEDTLSTETAQYTPAYTAEDIMLKLMHVTPGVLQAAKANGSILNLQVANYG